MAEGYGHLSDSGQPTTDSAADVCPLCFGTGTHLHPERGAIRCECRRADLKQNLLRVARIPERYSACNFNSFKTSPGTNDAFTYAKTLVEEYPAVDRGLLLVGPVGVGKTHLAVSIIRGLINKGFACVFSEFGSLLKQIQESYSPISKSSELSVLSPIYQADVLVLDELGANIPTDWVRDTMYQIINRRYNDKKLTIFTTNYEDEVVTNEATSARSVGRKSKAERRVDTLEDRIGTRLRSRLYEMCKTVRMEGGDYRVDGLRHLNTVSRSSRP